jgi:uncharacterized protein YrzB (UPF0473 family)
MQNEVENIVLLDEKGNEVEFEVVTKLDIENNEYVIVIPVEGEEDAVALKMVKDEEGNEALASVDDEEEFAMVAEAYELLALEEN